MKLAPQKKIKTHPHIPGDKSISHRCLILAALAHGTSYFKNLSQAEDVLSTQNVLRQLGVKIQTEDGITSVVGQGLDLQAPAQDLECGNAGTLMRLMMGILAGQKFSTCLVGDQSLMGRPMDRVASPLAKLGAQIQLSGRTAPVRIDPAPLTGGTVTLDIPSAQVKSALMLAGFYTSTPVHLTGALRSRDHTERLFQMFGIEMQKTETSIAVQPRPRIRPVEFTVPGDPSAAAFWIAASLLAGQECEIKNVSLNPSRLGFLNIFANSGIEIAQTLTHTQSEPVGDLMIDPKAYAGFEILPPDLPSLIDEIPVLCLLATQATSDSVIFGAGELRVKETDRIVSTQEMLQNLGLQMRVEGDNLYIPGKQTLRGGSVNSYKDHRIAMTAAVASFKSEGSIEILNAECASVSDPHFWGNFL